MKTTTLTSSPFNANGLLPFNGSCLSPTLPPKTMVFVNRDGLIRGCHALHGASDLEKFKGQLLFDVWPGESSQMTFKLLQAAFFTGTIQAKQVNLANPQGSFTAEVIVIPINTNDAMVVIR